MAKTEPLAARLKRLRESKKLNVDTLAEKTGVSRATLYRLESLGGKPQMDTVAALAKFFRVTIGQVRGTEAWPRGGDS